MNLRSIFETKKEEAPVVEPEFPRNHGYCPICEKEAVFEKRSEKLRDNYICLGCGSIPRFRAVLNVLHRFFPRWRELDIHESSPGGASAIKLRREGKRYSWSHFFEDTPLGEMKENDRCEDLTQLTFPDSTFDLFITQDCFEHIFEPEMAFAEIGRVLKPGGAHVFTVPWYPHLTTSQKRSTREGGVITHHAEEQYHGNPSREDRRSLVTTDWGLDIADVIHRASGLTTLIYLEKDPHLGLEGPMLEVFISRKPQA